MVSLSHQDFIRLKNSSEIAQRIEDKWAKRLDREISRAIEESSKNLLKNQSVVTPDFEKLLIQHYFETQIAALTLAEKESELEKRRRLASRPKTLKEIMNLYDRWRKGLFKPKNIQKKANSIKREYLSAVQNAWKSFSEKFRSGEEFTQEAVKKDIQSATQATSARVQTIVRTETTRYYNAARKTYYDASTDVTHYLFIAIRDKATTKWCSASTTNGKRGRSGLIYAKDDPLLQRESPPVHWNCRSELLPLTPHNPSHKRMIEDSSLARRNHVCHPLPAEWNK